MFTSPVVGLDVQNVPYSNLTWMRSALVSNVQRSFYFHLAHPRKEDQRYLDPALNTKLDHVPYVTW